MSDLRDTSSCTYVHVYVRTNTEIFNIVYKIINIFTYTIHFFFYEYRTLAVAMSAAADARTAVGAL